MSQTAQSRGLGGSAISVLYRWIRKFSVPHAAQEGRSEAYKSGVRRLDKRIRYPQGMRCMIAKLFFIFSELLNPYCQELERGVLENFSLLLFRQAPNHTTLFVVLSQISPSTILLPCVPLSSMLALSLCSCPCLSTKNMQLLTVLFFCSALDRSELLSCMEWFARNNLWFPHQNCIRFSSSKQRLPHYRSLAFRTTSSASYYNCHPLTLPSPPCGKWFYQEHFWDNQFPTISQ